MVAKKVGADGCHLGQADMSIRNARKIIKNKIIGVTCHNSLKMARKAIKNKANYIPGSIDAGNKSVTGISIIGPITTNIILGGIKIPKVPPAVIVPAARRTSYLDLFIDLAAMIPRIVTEAPTIPVAAANITETKSTA